MDDIKGIEWLLQQGGGYALAGLIFFFYRKDVLRRLEELKEEKSILIDLVSEVKVTLNELTLLIRAKS